MNRSSYALDGDARRVVWIVDPATDPADVLARKDVPSLFSEYRGQRCVARHAKLVKPCVWRVVCCYAVLRERQQALYAPMDYM